MNSRKYISIGILLVTFRIAVGNVLILPPVAGYGMICYHIWRMMQDEAEDGKEDKILALCLTVLSGALEIFRLCGKGDSLRFGWVAVLVLETILCVRLMKKPVAHRCASSEGVRLYFNGMIFGGVLALVGILFAHELCAGIGAVIVCAMRVWFAVMIWKAATPLEDEVLWKIYEDTE